jgi:hypothetical protein
MVQTRTSPGPIAKPDGADQAETLLNHVFRSRPLDLRAGTCVERPCRKCLVSHLLRVRRSIVVEEPLHFVLPGFQAKSPSPKRSWARDLTWPRSRLCSICSGSVTSQRLSLPARRADHHLLRPRDRGRAWPR